MSPYLYQLNRIEFCKVWKSVRHDKKEDKYYEAPMSLATLSRRKKWAQENYPQWRKVFLAGGRVDLREYQKFESFRSDQTYEEQKDPYQKALEEG